IGGSPASTAGGIKTTTFALCILMVYSMIHGGEDIVIFNKRIRKRLMLQALSIFAISLAICLVALIAMIIVQPNADVLDLMLEVFSGFGTVGLSASLTGTLNDSAKMIIIFLMYTGRIGPVSMMVLFARQSRKNKTSIKYPSEDILVG
ncbi:MAG: potassium transporter TrkG, partial [bacterium]